jgi:membrane fusion protein, multidrug efflux system
MSNEQHSAAVPAETASPIAAARAAGRSAGGKRWRAVGVVAILVLAAGGFGGRRYFWSLTHETTDDAQVEGHIHAVSSRVPGYVAEVCVQDNQIVVPGDVLVRVRAEDYQARVALAEANLAESQAGLAAAEGQVDVLRRSTAAATAQAQADVQQAEAQVVASRQDADSAAARLAAAVAGRQQAQSQAQAAQADSDYAAFNDRRIADLRAKEEAAEDEAELAHSNAMAAEARLRAANDLVNLSEAQITAAEHGLSAAKSAIAVAQAAVAKQKAAMENTLTGPDQVRVAEARAELARATVKSAQAQVDLAKLDLAYCTITAPAAGVVSRRSVEVGQYLQPGQPLLAVVPLDDTWVVASFKETELTDMRIGQPAVLRVDAYPDHPFEGHIESLAAGTGARFSLLPPENATGNFVKVVQRVPVKVVLKAGERDPQRPLRPGMNVDVTVDTRDRGAASGARQ